MLAALGPVVLLRAKSPCRKTVSPAGAVEHLCKIYNEKYRVRGQVQELVAGIQNPTLLLAYL